MATRCLISCTKMEKASDEIKAVAVSSTTVSPTTVSPAAIVSPATVVSSTTLQDLPVEVLDYILMKAVVQEVMDKKLAKSAWIDYASRVIKPLRTVCSQWNYRLTTSWFENMLHLNLDCIDPMAITVDLFASSRCDVCFWGFGRLNSKIYCIESLPAQYETETDTIPSDASLHVFEEQDTTHSLRIIPLPLMKELGGMTICKRSNSMYIWQTYHTTSWRSGPSVWHLVPDWIGGFESLHWPTYAPPSEFLDRSTIRQISIQNLSVLDDGNLLVLRRGGVLYREDAGDVACEEAVANENDDDDVVYKTYNILSVHKPNGLVIRNINLLHDGELSNVAVTSDGNFVYAQEICDDNVRLCVIRVFDQDFKEICSFRWLHECDFGHGGRKQLFLDSYDRVILHDGYHSLLFLDSELNILEEVDTLKTVNWNFDTYVMLHADFDKETNEMVVMYFEGDVLFLKLSL